MRSVTLFEKIRTIWQKFAFDLVQKFRDIVKWFFHELRPLQIHYIELLFDWLPFYNDKYIKCNNCVVFTGFRKKISRLGHLNFYI